MQRKDTPSTLKFELKKKKKNRDPEHRETKAKKKSKQWPDPKI